MATRSSPLDGVLVVDKPAGPTSHDVVDRVRRVLGTRRVGHTGTLDPFATGVLPVCIGRATRLARFLAETDKAYVATVRLGVSTTTDDLTGTPVGEPRAVAVAPADVVAACRRLTGALDQVPPAYSAKRSGGRRLYELARAGVAVSPAAAPVTVHRLEVVAVDGSRVDLSVRCSAGTYIRALARDLGHILGTGAHLEALRRIEAAGFGLADAVALEALDASSAGRVWPLGRILTQMPAVRVGPEGRERLRHGRDLREADVVAGWPAAPPPRLRVLDDGDELLALALPRGFEGADGLPPQPVLHPDVVLVD